MNCLDCQELLQRRLDGERIATDAALDQHLSQCATCREQHAAALRLLDGLAALPKPKPSAGLAQALTVKVLQDRQQRRAKWQRRVVLTMALAASVMLILLSALYWLPRPPAELPIAKDDPKKELPEKPPIPEHHAKQPPTRSPLTPLMDRWADATRDHAKVVLVATNLDAVENLPAVEHLPTIDPGVREASQEVTDGVRTVTRNARRALDFFARELPMPELGEPRN